MKTRTQPHRKTTGLAMAMTATQFSLVIRPAPVLRNMAAMLTPVERKTAAATRTGLDSFGGRIGSIV